MVSWVRRDPQGTLSATSIQIQHTLQYISFLEEEVRNRSLLPVKRRDSAWTYSLQKLPVGHIFSARHSLGPYWFT